MWKDLWGVFLSNTNPAPTLRLLPSLPLLICSLHKLQGEQNSLCYCKRSTNICSCWKPLSMIKSLLCGFRHCLQWTKVHCPPCPACKCLYFCCGYLFCGSVNSKSYEFFRLFPCSCWNLWCCRHWLLIPFPLVPVDSVENLSVSVVVALCIRFRLCGHGNFLVTWRRLNWRTMWLLMALNT